MPTPRSCRADRGATNDPSCPATHGRYVFVHSFEDTGEREVVQALESHPWTRSHVAQAAVAGGGCALTSAIPAAEERRGATGTALSDVRDQE